MKNPELRRWWALGAPALSVLVVGLDLTVLNLALPTLAADLHASTGFPPRPLPPRAAAWPAA